MAAGIPVSSSLAPGVYSAELRPAARADVPFSLPSPTLLPAFFFFWKCFLNEPPSHKSSFKCLLLGNPFSRPEQPRPPTLPRQG